MSIRILLADDHVVVREGLRDLLTREGFDVVAEASNGREAIRLNQELRPDVSVVDLSMPLLNGLDVTREIRRQSPKSSIILLTMYSDEPHVLEALQAGVAGYVLKSAAAADLVQAIHCASRGKVYLSPEISRTVVRAYLDKTSLSPDPLTGRERQVLQLVAEGKTTKEVAGLLGLSIKTVESHRTHIMRKLDIHDVANLVRYAIRRGLIRP